MLMWISKQEGDWLQDSTLHSYSRAMLSGAALVKSKTGGIPLEVAWLHGQA
jgi:hypothetical protein